MNALNNPCKNSNDFSLDKCSVQKKTAKSQEYLDNVVSLNTAGTAIQTASDLAMRIAGCVFNIQATFTVTIKHPQGCLACL